MYALADAKHTTVGALMGTDRRKLTVFLPPALAEICGEPTIEIVEERDGLSAEELTMWRAYYELQAEKERKKQKQR